MKQFDSGTFFLFSIQGGKNEKGTVGISDGSNHTHADFG